MKKNMFNRRQMLTLAAGGLGSVVAGPALAQSFVGEIEADSDPLFRRNVMGFRTVHWRDRFDSLRNGAIICDNLSHAVHFWSEDERTYLLYPCSVPMFEEFTRRGRTEIVLKRKNPTWIPTPNMRQRDPTCLPSCRRARTTQWEHGR